MCTDGVVHDTLHDTHELYDTCFTFFTDFTTICELYEQICELRRGLRILGGLSRAQGFDADALGQATYVAHFTHFRIIRTFVLYNSQV